MRATALVLDPSPRDPYGQPSFQKTRRHPTPDEARYGTQAQYGSQAASAWYDNGRERQGRPLAPATVRHALPAAAGPSHTVPSHAVLTLPPKGAPIPPARSRFPPPGSQPYKTRRLVEQSPAATKDNTLSSHRSLPCGALVSTVSLKGRFSKYNPGQYAYNKHHVVIATVLPCRPYA